MLSEETLDTLAAWWRDIGAPIAAHLAPGLASDQMEALTAPLGIALPDEARVWWGWHDGVIRATPLSARMTGSGWQFLSLSEAVEETESRRRLASEIAGADADGTLWSWTWLVVSSDVGGDVLAIDATQSSALESPIYLLVAKGGSVAPPRAASFGELVDLWLSAFASGAYGFDRTGSRWTYDTQRLDPAAGRSGLA